MSGAIELVELNRIDRRSDDFRFRSAGIDKAHKADLVRAIVGLGGRPLDPVMLWEMPDAGPTAKLAILDGVHSIAAYRASGWDKPIPAVIFRGDRRGALGVALSRNAKHVLPLPQIDRLNAAWRLVREPVEPRFKVAEVARLATVSARVVDKMRARWRAMREAGQEPTGDWSRDQHAAQVEHDMEEDMMSDKERAAAIDALRNEIRDLLDRRKRPDQRILRDAEAVDEAILRALGDQRFKAIASYYFGEVADEWAEDAKAVSPCGDGQDRDAGCEFATMDF